MIKYTILATRTQGELALSYSKHALSTEVSSNGEKENVYKCVHMRDEMGCTFQFFLLSIIYYTDDK